MPYFPVYLRFSLILAFVATLSSAATSRPALRFQNSFGGSGTDTGTATAVDRDGNIYITGTTNSLDFPTRNPLQATLGGAYLRLSLNQGSSWATPAIAGPIFAVAGSPQQPKTLYAGTRTGILKSVDRGGSWVPLRTMGTSQTNALVISSGNPNTIYAATDAGIFRSNNSGATWQTVAFFSATILVPHSTEPATLFSVDVAGTVYRTVDGGDHWDPLRNAPQGVYAFTGDTAHPGTFYAAVSIYDTGGSGRHLFLSRSTDNGDTWFRVAALPVSQSHYALAANATGVYAATENGIFISRDGGISWNPTSISAPATNVVADPADPRVIYASADLIYRTTDAGLTWNVALPIRQTVQMLAVVPGSPSAVLVGAIPGQNIFLTKWSSDGKQMLYSTYFGGSYYDFATGVAVDAQGNAFVAGYTFSTDFPTTTGAAQTANRGQANAFVAKISPQGDNLLYSSYLGGTGSDGASAIALDGGGNVLLTGYAGSSDFPVTIGAAQPNLHEQCPSPSTTAGTDPYNLGDAFVAKINIETGHTIYSTFLGGTCSEQGYGITADAGGNAVVVGVTNSPDFPISSAAAQRARTAGAMTGFVARLTPLGAILSASYLGSAGTSARAVAMDAKGAIYITGTTPGFDVDSPPNGSPAFLIGVISLYPTPQLSLGFPGYQKQAAYLLKLDSSATGVLALTYVGAGGLEGQSISVDQRGRTWIAGPTTSSPFLLFTVGQDAGLSFSATFGSGGTTVPTIHPFQAKTGNGFVSELSSDGSTLLFSSEINGGGALTLDPGGNVFLTGSSRLNGGFGFGAFLLGTTIPPGVAFTRLEADVLSAVTVEEPQRLIASTGTTSSPTGVAPGELIVLRGEGLGPEGEIAAQLTIDGTIPVTLAGTTVSFDGKSAPLLSVQAGRIVCVVPFASAALSTTLIQVQSASGQSNSVRMGTAVTQVGIVGVINPDGTTTANRPAAPGSVISVYAVGLGQTTPPSADGEVTGTSAPRTFVHGSPALYIDDTLITPLYVGSAPGQLDAVTQINLQLPVQLSPGTHTLMLSGSSFLAGDFISVPIIVAPR